MAKKADITKQGIFHGTMIEEIGNVKILANDMIVGDNLLQNYVTAGAFGNYSSPSYTTSYIVDDNAPNGRATALKLTIDTSASYGGGMYIQNANGGNYVSRMTAGAPYTFSFYVKANKNTTINIPAHCEFFSNEVKESIPVTTQWQKVVLHGTYNGNTSSTGGVAMTIYYGNNWKTQFATNDILYLSSCKLEAGNIATPWVPSDFTERTNIISPIKSENFYEI